MAKPVKIQGIVTLILFGLMALMLAGAVVVAVLVVGQHAKENGLMAPDGSTGGVGQGSSGEQGPSPNPQTPFQGRQGPSASPATPAAAISGPSVVWAIKIAPPVVYVIDGGASMADTYDAAFGWTRGSIKTLAPDQKFSVVVAGASQDSKMGDFVGGGSAGVGAAKAFFDEVHAGYGASNLARAIDAALALKPATIVIFCRKAIPVETAEKAKAGGVKIVGIGMDAGSDVMDSLTELAKQTGGEVKALSKRDSTNGGGESD
jgi:hypothetical protein